MTPTCYIGVDPGLHGALVVLTTEGDIMYSVRADEYTERAKPKSARRLYMPTSMRTELARFCGPQDASGLRFHVCIEAQQAMPKQGVSSSFLTGRGYGLWEGLVVGLGLPYTIVQPRAWTKAMLAGVSGEGKARSILAAQRRWPAFSLVPKGCRKPDDALADAALIAAYVMRMEGA